MKGFSFDSFVVHETNQAAYDMCRRLASMDKGVPRPIVLLGESGSGKSHLLWAIVNHFRELNAKVGVALISSKDFPGKVKSLPENPEKLKKKYPVILIVDELHLFEKDVADLERVAMAFQEHNQYVVIATNIHPSVLPSLSGKLKSYINAGAIIGIKPLPKSAGAPIPDAVVKQIASLKARVTELEAEKGPADAVPEDAMSEINALRKQLENLKHERDVARTALERSEGELIDLREELTRLQGGSQSEGQSVVSIVERLEKQKTVLVARIGSLEQQLEELIEFTHAMGREDGEELPAAAAGKVTGGQEEADLLRVIDGIRDTLRHFEDAADDDARDEESADSAKKMLATIAEQLRALDKPSDDDIDDAIEYFADSEQSDDDLPVSDVEGSSGETT